MLIINDNIIVLITAFLLFISLFKFRNLKKKKRSLKLKQKIVNVKKSTSMIGLKTVDTDIAFM